jgi:hypothetical protein
LVPLASAYIATFLDRMLAEAQRWDIDDWLSYAVLSEFQGAVRMVVAFGREMFLYLDRIPYLLCRLRQPGIKDTCFQQFALRPMADHHRLSCEFLSPSQPLYADVRRVRDDGSGFSSQLDAEVNALEEIPLDDTVNEGPHSSFQRIVLAARRSNFAWQASSLRLSQNLADARELVPAVGCDAQHLWNIYSSVLQVHRRAYYVSMRCTRKIFEERLYTLYSLDGAQYAAADAVDDDEAGGSGDDGDGSCPARKVARLALPAAPLADGIDLDLESENARLMSEWLVSAMKRYTYVSVATVDPDPIGDKVVAFQVLSVKSQQALVKTFEDAEPIRYGLRCTVQPLDMWRGAEITADDPNLFAMAVSSPCDVDLLRVCGVSPNERCRVKQWDQVESDLEGAIALGNPRELTVNCALKDKAVPVLCLLDKLSDEGYIGQHAVVNHTPASGMFYDKRNSLSKRTYFQCVLARQSLFDKGVKKFTSLKSQQYYVLLLQSRGPLPQHLSSEECTRQLKDLAGEAVFPLALQDRVGPRPAPVALALLDDDVDGDGPGPSLPAIADAASTSSSSSSSSSAPSSVSSGDVDGEAFPGIPEEILGQPVRVETHRDRGDKGIRVFCNNPDHPGCNKYKSMRLDVQVFGPMAAVHFMSTWLSRAFDMPMEMHRAWKPSKKDIRQYLESPGHNSG